MLPSKHAILGLIFSLILLLIFPDIGLIEATIIFFSSVLIDVDHYLYFIIAKKDLSLKKAYNWHLNNMKKYMKLLKKERKKVRFAYCIFHGVEILVILFVLAFYFKLHFLYFVLIGFSFHLFLDILNMFFRGLPATVLFSQLYNGLVHKLKISIEEY